MNEAQRQTLNDLASQRRAPQGWFVHPRHLKVVQNLIAQGFLEWSGREMLTEYVKPTPKLEALPR